MTYKLNSRAGTLTLGALALMSLTCQGAFADDTGWYGGANVGRSKANIDNARITNGLAGQGFSVPSISDRENGTGFKLFGGYQVNRYLGLEGGYFDLGKFGYTATTQPVGTLRGDLRLKGVNLDIVGTLPVTERFFVLARAGVNYARASDRFSGTGAVTATSPTASKRSANVKFGAGVGYALTESLSMRLEAERYRMNDAVGNHGDIDLFSIGLVYRFGTKASKPVAQPVAYAPVEVVAAPAPVAVVVIPPPPPPPPPPRIPAKVTFSADSLFDFDQSVVKPNGRQALDEFARELKGSQYDSIHVTGHTDRIGTHVYNQRLSERRAQAVGAYLVDAAGIPAGKITTRGVSDSDPATHAGDCKGKSATPALITCLQPDRRVEVEVTGTR